MKKIFFLFFAITISCTTKTMLAQNYRVTQGTEFEPPADSKWGTYAGENEKSFYTLRIKTKGRGTKYFIEGMDKTSLKKYFETELPLEEEAHVGLDPVSLDMRILCSEERIYVCFKGFNKDEKTNKYFIKVVFADGKLGDLLEIASTTEKFDVNLYINNDKSKILMIFENPWNNGHQDVTATLFNADNFSKIWKKQMPDEYKGASIETYYYKLNNAGDFCFLFNYLISKDPQVIGKGMGVVNNGTEKAKFIVFPNKDNHEIENGRVEFTEAGKFIFTGLFKENVSLKEGESNGLSKKEKAKLEQDHESKKRAGIFSYYVDVATSNLVTNFEFFPEDVAQKLSYSQGLVLAGAGHKYYTASGLENLNGDFYLFENHKYTISGNGVATFEREFIVTKINSKGAISWTKIFPKNTVNSLNTFNILKHDGRLYVFYLEHPKNLEKSTINDYEPTKYADIKTYNGSVVVGLEISSDGSAVRKQIFENSGWCYDPQPYNILLAKDNKLLIRMINRGRERFDAIAVD